MNVYIVFEYHDIDAKERESTIDSLINQRYVIGAEGHHDLNFFNKRYRLEDIFYQIYTEVAMSYLSACEKKPTGIKNAIDQLKAISSIRDYIKIEVYMNDGVISDETNKIMNELDILINCYDTYQGNYFESIAWSCLVKMNSYVLSYSKNIEYTGKPNIWLAKDDIASLNSIDLVNFKMFSSLNQKDRIKFGSSVLSKLRDIALSANIKRLIQCEIDKNNVLIILGRNHANGGLLENIIDFCKQNNFPMFCFFSYKALLNNISNTRRIETQSNLKLFNNKNNQKTYSTTKPPTH